MTKQDYENKLNRLVTIKNRIDELEKESISIRCELAQYKYMNEIRGKYFFSPDLEIYYKPIKLNKEKVICITVDYDKDPYKDFKDYHIEEDFVWVDEFENFQEIDKETFYCNIEAIIKESYNVLIEGE